MTESGYIVSADKLLSSKTVVTKYASRPKLKILLSNSSFQFLALYEYQLLTTRPTDCIFIKIGCVILIDFIFH
jgi:hypothetical protein